MIYFDFNHRNDSTLEQRITALSLNHQILSPYTAFVGVETNSQKHNNTLSQVRYVPIQISRGDEHLFDQQQSVRYYYRMPHFAAPMASMGYRPPRPMGFGHHSYSPALAGP